MATNDFKTFASASGANVISQAAYQSLAAAATGFQSGIAQSAQLNKVWRQSSILASMVAQFIADETGQNSVDDGTIATLEANFILAIQAITGIKLTATLNVFVSPSGSDTNNGLTPSTPFATIPAAVRLIYNQYDFNGNSGVINLAAGTYTTPVVLSGMPVGCIGVRIQGNNSSPSSTIISVTNATAVTAVLGCNLSLSGIQLSATGVATPLNQIGIGVLSEQSTVILNSVILGSTGTAQLLSAQGSTITSAGNAITFAGTNVNGMIAQTGSQVFLSNSPITFSGTPSYSTGWAVASQSGTIVVTTGGTTSFTGSFTGRRYAVSLTSSIFTNGAGTTFFPGSVAGTADATTFGSYS